mmetsp:Transcript_3921/g.12029  ORF Transcript_3921/g.12029 Transcript_3921/m.12029 type:complete len:490 (+) Transcript_3921:1160-2629(+)
MRRARRRPSATDRHRHDAAAGSTRLGHLHARRDAVARDVHAGLARDGLAQHGRSGRGADGEEVLPAVLVSARLGRRDGTDRRAGAARGRPRRPGRAGLGPGDAGRGRVRLRGPRRVAHHRKLRLVEHGVGLRREPGAHGCWRPLGTHHRGRRDGRALGGSDRPDRADRHPRRRGRPRLHGLQGRRRFPGHLRLPARRQDARSRSRDARRGDRAREDGAAARHRRDGEGLRGIALDARPERASAEESPRASQHHRQAHWGGWPHHQQRHRGVRRLEHRRQRQGRGRRLEHRRQRDRGRNRARDRDLRRRRRASWGQEGRLRRTDARGQRDVLGRCHGRQELRRLHVLRRLPGPRGPLPHLRAPRRTRSEHRQVHTDGTECHFQGYRDQSRHEEVEPLEEGRPLGSAFRRVHPNIPDQAQRRRLGRASCRRRHGGHGGGCPDRGWRLGVGAVRRLVAEPRRQRRRPRSFPAARVGYGGRYDGDVASRRRRS